MEEAFVFERLDVYQRALEFARKIFSTTNQCSRPFAWSDQFSRAATSIVLNIAEGAGRHHPREKRNFYRIARGSLSECIPLIELGRSLDILDEGDREELRSDCVAIAKMLTRLIQNQEKKG